MGIFDFFGKKKTEVLHQGLEKTREGFLGKLKRGLLDKSQVDDEVLDALEETLISSDVGVATTTKIISAIEKRVSKDKYLGSEELQSILKEEISRLMRENHALNKNLGIPEHRKPHVIMVVGVNGVGKTTSIGKLAWQFKQQGKSVLLGAADTFRAAAVEQLKIWGQRTDVEVIDKGMNADPASVAFDTLNAALARNSDVVIIDTAGRLHNKKNLMNELSKVKSVMSKVIENAPHEVLLVLLLVLFVVCCCCRCGCCWCCCCLLCVVCCLLFVGGGIVTGKQIGRASCRERV